MFYAFFVCLFVHSFDSMWFFHSLSLSLSPGTYSIHIISPVKRSIVEEVRASTFNQLSSVSSVLIIIFCLSVSCLQGSIVNHTCSPTLWRSPPNFFFGFETNIAVLVYISIEFSRALLTVNFFCTKKSIHDTFCIWNLLHIKCSGDIKRGY